MGSNTEFSTTIRSSLVKSHSLRLDSYYYTNGSTKAEDLLRKSGLELKTVGDLAKIHYLPRFIRIWSENETDGYPYLSASEVFQFKPLRNRFISKTKVENPESFFAQPGWVLIECSGTIGTPLYVNSTISRYFLDNHLLRLEPRDPGFGGYLYAYLSTEVGQTLLKRGQYGAVIKEIDPKQVRPIPVPVAKNETRRRINEKIVRAWELRDEANRLESEAISELESLIDRS